MKELWIASADKEAKNEEWQRLNLQLKFDEITRFNPTRHKTRAIVKCSHSRCESNKARICEIKVKSASEFHKQNSYICGSKSGDRTAVWHETIKLVSNRIVLWHLFGKKSKSLKWIPTTLTKTMGLTIYLLLRMFGRQFFWVCWWICWSLEILPNVEQL